ncbi:MAG TPA: hypothetical protein VMF13_16930 [Luteitalea sp.]|nr:hypothetical protein [Luteitalea sp.]
MRKRTVLHVGLIAVAVVLGVALVIGLTARPRLEGWLRNTVIATLEKKLDAEVELQEISVRPGWVTSISGGPLVIRHRAHLDKAPLVKLERFETTMTWRELLRRPRRVDTIVLTGLAITIPPSPAPGQPRLPGLGGPKEPTPAVATTTVPVASTASAGEEKKGPAIIIGRITADNATLTILPRELRKLPRIFGLNRLTIRDVSSDRAMSFATVVQNPQPRGLVETSGTFGPWNVESPSQTPLQADYRFLDGDLNTIKGIEGRVQSQGRYSGVLERIQAEGTSTTPDFGLDVGGKKMPLATTFTVVVDGTNGNTYIQPAMAMLGKATPITVTGGVVKAEDTRGRTVDLATQIVNGRLEEVLALVIDGDPVMTGRIDLTGALLIPPGPVKVVEKMTLEGRFTLGRTLFRSTAVQKKLDELSRRAQGRPGDQTVARVVSAFSGRFRMADGVVRFPSLTFRVDGARVELKGAYTVRGQGLNFDGRVRLDAGVSQMVGGKKRFFLRPFDGLFRRNGATEFPIHIRGSVKKPEFGVDVKETLKRALIPGR